MRTLKMALSLLCLFAGLAQASPQAPVNGKEYKTLQAPQPTQAEPKKIEVIEFFAYHCPACNAFEPAIADWVKRNADKVTFRRVHAPLRGPNDPEAHLFLTLQAMKLEDAMHDKVLRTWHVERKRLENDEANLEWAARNGIPADRFRSFYQSFSVLASLRKLPSVVGAYQVDSTPSFAVDGRYVFNPAMIGEANGIRNMAPLMPATTQVLDALVAQALRSKGGK